MMRATSRPTSEGCPMRAILFDLDGTLLDLDLEAFLDRYFSALETAAVPLARRTRGTNSIMDSIGASVRAMTLPHAGETNEAVFYREFLAHTGIDLTEHWPVFGDFYAEVFPTLRDTARPAKGGRRAIETAMGLGLRVAIATNPIFPRAAIEQRMDWAGILDLPVDVVTTYEVMEATKPLPDYYRQVAAMLGVAPAECLMVGDDRSLDMPAADIGMRTFYVGPDEYAYADGRGDLDDLADALPLMTGS